MRLNFACVTNVIPVVAKRPDARRPGARRPDARRPAPGAAPEFPTSKEGGNIFDWYSEIISTAFSWLALAVIPLGTACQPATEAPPPRAWQTEDEQHYTLHWANLSLTVDAQGGGRIVSLRVADEELLTDTAVHPIYYGSTLWLSPQHRWWPQPPAINTDPYLVQSTTNPLVLMSQTDVQLGLQVRKTYLAEAADSSLRITYTVINRADTAQSVALWEVTRLPKDSEVTFALDAAADRNKPFKKHTSWTADQARYRVQVTAQDTAVDKAWYNARGWVRYTHGNRQLLKRFPDLRIDQLPPQQNEVEVYIDDSAYVEVEQHSAYQTLAPQDSLVWTVRWYPR